MTRRVPLIVVAFAVVLTAVTSACSGDEAISERSTPIPSPMVQVGIAPTPAPTLQIISEPSYRVGHQSLLLPNGLVMLGGGFLPEVSESGVIRTRPHPYLEFYDQTTREWWRASLPAPGLADVSLFLMPEGAVLITGTDKFFTVGNRDLPTGIPLSDEPATYRAFLFNPATEQFIELPPTTIPRFSPKFIVMDDGRVLSIGGTSSFTEGQQTLDEVSLEVEILDSAQGEWRRVAGPAFDSMDGLLGPDGKVMVMETIAISGGAALALFGQVGEETPAGAVARFEARSESWSIPIHFEFLYGVPRRVMAASGDSVHLLYEKRIETYDLRTGDVLVGFSGEMLPENGGLVTTPDNRVLFAGGSAGYEWTEPAARVSVFDPVNYAWPAAENLWQARVGHSLTPLPDGGVLVSGGLVDSPGSGQEQVPTNEAEVLSAELLSGIDTRSLRPELIPNPQLWSDCLGLRDVESPQPSSSDAVPPTESPVGLLAMALSALDALDSYASTNTSYAYWHEYFSMERGRAFVCELYAERLDAPWTLSTRSQSSEGPALFDYAHDVLIENQVFSIRWPSYEWARNAYEGTQLPKPRFRNLLDNRRAELTYVGVETLNGVDVFHVQELSTLSEGRTSFWIGVDDLVFRRVLHQQHRQPSPESIELAREEGRGEIWVPRLDSLTEFHSFNEDFNIQPPPDDEIARP